MTRRVGKRGICSVRVEPPTNEMVFHWEMMAIMTGVLLTLVRKDDSILSPIARLVDEPNIVHQPHLDALLLPADPPHSSSRPHPE